MKERPRPRCSRSSTRRWRLYEDSFKDRRWPRQCPRGNETITRMRMNLGRDRENSPKGDREKKLEEALKEIIGLAYHGARAEMPQLQMMEIIETAREAL